MTVQELQQIHYFLNSCSTGHEEGGHNTTKRHENRWQHNNQRKPRPGSVLHNNNKAWQLRSSDHDKSLGGRAAVLPWVELDRSDICLVGDIGAVYGSSVLGVFTIVFINLQVTPWGRADCICQVKPFGSKLLTLGLANSFLSSLLFLEPENFAETQGLISKLEGSQSAQNCSIDHKMRLLVLQMSGLNSR